MSPRGRFAALFWALSTLSTWAVAGNKSPGDTQVFCAGQIRYESDTDDAYKYLEAVQRQIYTQNPQLTDPFLREELIKPKSVVNLEQLKARAIVACPDPSSGYCALTPAIADELMKAYSCLTLPTRFESPLFFKMIQVFSSDVEKVRVSHFPGSSRPRFGSLPAGTFDAQAILPPGSKEPLVILNRDIFNFNGAFSFSIAYGIPITMTETVVKFDSSEEGIRRRLRDHPDIVDNFADAMARLVREGTSKGARQGTMHDDHNPLQARFLLGMNLFVISHEEAHVILGHVSDKSVELRLAGSHSKGTWAQAQNLPTHKDQVLPPLSKSRADEPLTTLRAELRTREQEFEADALGFRLMMWSWEENGERFGEPIAAAAPHIVFRVLDAASAYGSEAGGWTFSDANHPTAADRIKALTPIFDEVAKNSSPPWPADWPAVGGWRTAVDTAFKVLLEEADPQIRLYLGLRPRAKS